MITTGREPADDANPSVDHPSHYNVHPSGVECIDVVRHMGFNLGNVVKYLWRSGEKDQEPSLQDLEKAAWYLNDEIRKRKQDLESEYEDNTEVDPLAGHVVDALEYNYVTIPSTQYPYGCVCLVHGRVHNSHGWYVCVPKSESIQRIDPTVQFSQWLNNLGQELQKATERLRAGMKTRVDEFNKEFYTGDEPKQDPPIKMTIDRAQNYTSIRTPPETQ